MTSATRLHYALPVLLCATLLAACPQREPVEQPPQADAPLAPVNSTQDDDATLSIVVTVRPLALVVQPLLGGNARLHTLLPAGVDAHSYEPKPSDAKLLEDADALLWVSEELDGWATELGSGLQVQVAQLLPQAARRRLDAEEAAGGGHEGHNHGEGGAIDPHFWADPAAVAAVMPRLAEVLKGLDPENGSEYDERAEAAVAKLEELGKWAEQQLAGAKDKAVLEMHPSMGYLLDRYGIASVGAVAVAPGREPTPQHLAELVRAARAGKAACVVTEPQLPDKAAKAIATEAGLPLVQLDPEAAATDQSYADYEAWFVHNVQALARALK